jgi:hypothetical protein
VFPGERVPDGDRPDKEAIQIVEDRGNSRDRSGGNLNRPIQAIVENIFRKRDTSTILGYDVRRVANTVRRHPTSDFIFTRGDMVLGQQFRARRRAQGADLI